ERLLHPFGETEEDPVDGEERPRLPGGMRTAEGQVDHRVEEPAGNDERLPPHAVRERAGGRGGERLDEGEERREDRHQGRGDPELVGAEEEEGVRRVAEGEEEEDGQVGPEAARQRGPELEARRGGGRRLAARRLAEPEDEKGDGERRRDRGQE